MQKAKFRSIVFLVAFWGLAALFGAFWEGAIRGFEAPDSLSGVPYSFGQELVIIVVGATLASVVVASFDVLVLGALLRKRPLGLTLVARAAFYVACIVAVISVVVLSTQAARHGRGFLDPVVISGLGHYWSTPEAIVTVIYWAFAVLFGLFVVQVAESFGQGVLIHFLLGKYHRPKEEDRIFMFVDLKSSTQHAERLGHVDYSRLIQDCFFDLSDAVVRHGAVVYQYVGDEVVLTWKRKDGLAGAACLRSYYDYDRRLKARRAHYDAEYGVVPEFKAAAHVGPVTAAEVGAVKKELAFHGDVLNTASRIQGKCVELGCPLLISEDLRALLDGVDDFEFRLEGSVELKGMAEPVVVHSATPVRKAS